MLSVLVFYECQLFHRRALGCQTVHKPWIWFDEFFPEVVGTTNLKKK